MRSVLSFGSAPLGFAPDNVVVASGTLPAQRFGNAARKIAFYDQLRRKLGALAGIESAAVASTLPPYGLGLTAIEIQGKPVSREARRHDVGQAAIGPEYFRVFRVPLLRGRAFNEQDRPQTDRVAVINEALAREYFPDQNPIGQQIRVGDEREWLTVVGIAGNERRPQVFQEMSWIEQPAVYRSLVQDPPDYFSIAVRTVREQAGLGRAIEQSVGSIDAGVPVDEVRTMRARLAPYLKYPRFRAIVLAAFASLAVLLAAVGLYGVLAQFVAQRTREIGVRMAVGAGRRDVFALVMKKGGWPVLAGLAVGLMLTTVVTRYLSNLLYGITPTDHATFAAVTIILLASAAVAMILPARRASRVDPMVALRSE